MNQTHQKPHALLFPYPLQGHVIPFVNLAIKLASNGFTITFINTQSVHLQISKAGGPNINEVEGNDLFSGTRKSGLDIRDVTIYDGFPVDFDRSLNHDKYFEAIMNDFVFHVDELGKLVLSNPSPNILVADTFYVWPSTIAKKYNLVNISYWTEPALVFSVYYHLELLRQNGHYYCIDKCEDIIDYIPGVRRIKPTDLASYIQSKETNMVVNQIINRAFKDVKKKQNLSFVTLYKNSNLKQLQHYKKVCQFMQLDQFSPLASPTAQCPRACGPSLIAPIGSTPSPMVQSCTSRLGATLIPVKKILWKLLMA